MQSTHTLLTPVMSRLTEARLPKKMLRLAEAAHSSRPTTLSWRAPESGGPLRITAGVKREGEPPGGVSVQAYVSKLWLSVYVPEPAGQTESGRNRSGPPVPA